MASAISGFINQIRTAVYGEQVRGAIVSALEACYSDVNNPSLQTEAFETALNEAYAGGILDIQTVTSFNSMTNQNIIYRYNGTAAGKQKGLYYYSALSNSWVLIGSEIQKVSLASQMTDVNDIYKYIGTESGMVQNSLYCHNGTSWAPIGSGLLTASTAAQMTNTSAIYKYTGNEAGYTKYALYFHNGTDWEPIAAAIDEQKNLLQIFSKFVGVGDSLMCGYSATADRVISSAVARERKANWFEFMMLDINRRGVNVAVGGTKASDWRYNTNGANIEAANIYADCYIIGLGVNDRGTTVGSSTDIKAEKENNSNSFYGNYDFIIRQLHEYNENAQIFVFTIPTFSGRTELNNAIKAIAGLYSYAHVIDMADEFGENYNSGFIAANMYNGHYNTLTYRVMTSYIEAAMNGYIYRNYALFKNITNQAVPLIDIDNTLTVEGAAADSKAVGDAVAELTSEIERVSASGLNDAAIYLITTLFQNALYKDDMSDEIVQLGDALAGIDGVVKNGTELIINYLLNDTATQGGNILFIS